MKARNRVIEELEKMFPGLEQKFDTSGDEQPAHPYAPTPSIDDQEPAELYIKHDELVMISAALIAVMPGTSMIGSIIATERVQQYIRDHLPPKAIEELIARMDDCHRQMHEEHENPGNAI